MQSFFTLLTNQDASRERVRMEDRMLVKIRVLLVSEKYEENY